MKKSPLIKVESRLAVDQVLKLCVDKVGVKRVLKILSNISHNQTIMASGLGGLFANKKDEEMAAATCALYYLINNWDHAVDEGFRKISLKLEKKKEQPLDTVDESDSAAVNGYLGSGD